MKNHLQHRRRYSVHEDHLLEVASLPEAFRRYRLQQGVHFLPSRRSPRGSERQNLRGIALKLTEPYPLTFGRLRKDSSTRLTWFAPFAAAFFVVVLFGLGCAKHRVPRQVFLITLDTTRADHLGCYGATEVQTPNLDRLAMDSVLFLNACSETNITVPSHTAIFSSLHMKDHGVIDNTMALPNLPEFLPRLFQRDGFHTAAFASSNVLEMKTNFHQGFDVYDAPAVRKRIAEETNILAFSWLTENVNNDFFVWLHYFDPHMYYSPSPPFDQMYNNVSEERFSNLEIANRQQFEGPWADYLKKSDDPEYYRNLYKGEISYLDEHLGRLFDYLKELGIYDRCVIALVGDHGEGLGERNRYFVHQGIYDENILVPMMIKPANEPQWSPGVREHLASSIDLYPTILAILGVDFAGPIRGKNLVDIMRDPEAPDVRRIVFFERGHGPIIGVKSHQYTYFRRTHEKGQLLIQADEHQELYENAIDPAQINDLSSQEPGVVTRFNEAAIDFINDSLPVQYIGSDIADEKRLEQLKALGYLEE